MAFESWRKNLYAMVAAQFLVTMGLNFVSPFLPLYIQQLGNLTNNEAALWAGVASGGLGVAQLFSAPFWGILSDRWGRKLMVLRAQFGGAIIIALMSLAPNIYFIVALRSAQGLLAGTIAAASALVASTTPKNKIPFAMGLLMSAFFTGQTVGPLLGGSLADIVGYKATFFITTGLVSSGGLIVFFLVKKVIERKKK